MLPARTLSIVLNAASKRHFVYQGADTFFIGDAKKFDGIWYSIIRIHLGKCEYELLWHEDTGNAIYSLNQTEEENNLLQHRLERILDILNARIEKAVRQ